MSAEFNVKFRKPSQMSKPCTSRITHSKVVKKRGGNHPKIKTKKPFSKLKLENKTNLILNYFEPSKVGRQCESDQRKNRSKVEDGKKIIFKPSLRSLVKSTNQRKVRNHEVKRTTQCSIYNNNNICFVSELPLKRL